MSRIFAFACAITMLAFIPAMPAQAVDPTISAHCRPGAPEAYSRPGGFCAQLADNKSLATTVSGPFFCPTGTEAVPPHSRNCVDITD